MPVTCSNCGKHFLGQFAKLKPRNPIYQHIRYKHKGNAVPQAVVEEPESLAERHIQATLDEAMDVPNFDREWLI